jgi:hypothetical protein
MWRMMWRATSTKLFGQPDFISRSGPSILGNFGQVGSVLESFCPYDAVYFGLRVAREFWGYVRGQFAHKIRPTCRSDSPAAPTAINPKC